MESWLDEAGIMWSHSNKKLPCAPTTRFPDYLFVAEDHCVVLEVDEDQHRTYNSQCEIARISELMDSISFMNLHVIRFNPHAAGSTDARKRAVLEAVRSAVSYNFAQHNDTGCVVQYLGYDEDRVVALDQLSCELQQK